MATYALPLQPNYFTKPSIILLNSPIKTHLEVHMQLVDLPSALSDFNSEPITEPLLSDFNSAPI